MKSYLILFVFSLLGTTSFSQKTYKYMMYDMSINFYEVCDSAEVYFSKHDKFVKGSGWKGFQRWKAANEYKYYPSGDRSNVDPYFPQNAFKNYVLENVDLPKSLFNNGWEELGPFVIDSITGHYSAGLGRIEDVYVDPLNVNKMYVGSRSGGFWNSTDGGTTWNGGATDFLIATGVNTISASPTNSDSVLINLQNARNGYSHGIYRSIDGGLTWLESNFNPTNVMFGGLGDNFRIYKVVYHPRVPNLIFIGTNQGVYRSDDNLVTWTRLLNSSDIAQIEFHPTDDDIVYLYDNNYFGTNQNLILRSTDQGLNYIVSNEAIGNADNRSVRLSVSADCNNCLYFASPNGIWRSDDSGMNFNFLSTHGQGGGGFTVNDLDTSIMIYGALDLELSIDGGLSFNQITNWSLGNTNGAGSGNQNSFHTSTDYVHADLRMARCINGVFYVGTDGFFCKSIDNGVTWEVLSQGVATRENYKLGASQSNHYRSISGSQDNGTSIKHQGDWIEFYGADGMEGIIHPLNDDWMIGSLQYGGRRRTVTGGQTQTGATPSGSEDGGWEAPITYDPNNQMSVYDFRENVYMSTDFGANYALIGTPSSFIGTISQSAIAENNSEIIIISRGENIDKSVDGGASFVSIKNNLPDHSIEDIAFDPNSDDVMIVVNGRHESNGQKVYITVNGGVSWTNITSNLGNIPVRSVVIDHTNASNIYLGTEIGVYTKPMNGTIWTLYNPDLPNVAIEELEVVNGSNTLKAATWGRGMWEYTLVNRADFPTILKTRITDQPTSAVPLENIDQYVTSVVTYDNTLSSVYVEWSANAPTFGNVIPMSNTMDSTWGSDTPIPNYPFGTKMYFKVFAVGSAGDTTETYKFMYTVREVTYCNSSGTMDYQGNITYVGFNAIDNATGKTASYTDYTGTDSTEVITGQDYDLTVNLNTDNGDYIYFSTVWLDWNQDLDFDDVGEEYQLGSVSNSTDLATDLSPFTITIPLTALAGNTRIRVNCQFNSYQNDPCANGFDGEVEDYLIHVVPFDLSLEDNIGMTFTVYPNPTSGLVTIAMDEVNGVAISAIVQDALGQVVDVEAIKIEGGVVIDLSDQSNGIYYVRMTNVTGSALVKVVRM